MKRETPGPGQESVWDYPRPPRWERVAARLRVIVGETAVADSNEAYRVLETSHPPVYYFPRSSVRLDLLAESRRRSFCEWKGEARYYDFREGDRFISDFAWYYPDPSERFRELRGLLAFYPSKADACWYNEELAQAQEGDFYGGWINSHIVGPFKGPPGTAWW